MKYLILCLQMCIEASCSSTDSCSESDITVIRERFVENISLELPDLQQDLEMYLENFLGTLSDNVNIEILNDIVKNEYESKYRSTEEARQCLFGKNLYFLLLQRLILDSKSTFDNFKDKFKIDLNKPRREYQIFIDRRDSARIEALKLKLKHSNNRIKTCINNIKALKMLLEKIDLTKAQVDLIIFSLDFSVEVLDFMFLQYFNKIFTVNYDFFCEYFALLENRIRMTVTYIPLPRIVNLIRIIINDQKTSNINDMALIIILFEKITDFCNTFYKEINVYCIEQREIFNELIFIVKKSIII